MEAKKICDSLLALLAPPCLVPEDGDVAGELGDVEENGEDVEDLGAVGDGDVELLVWARHVEEHHPGEVEMAER